MGADELGTLRDFNAAAEHPRWCKSRTSRPDRQLSRRQCAGGVGERRGRRAAQLRLRRLLQRAMPMELAVAKLRAPDAHAVLEAKKIERNVHGMSQLQGRRSGRQQVLQRLRRSRPVPMRRVWCPEPSRIEVLL